MSVCAARARAALEALRSAVSKGVEAYAYNCLVTERSIQLDQSLPIRPYSEAFGND